jgi:hypothetical protein
LSLADMFRVMRRGNDPCHKIVLCKKIPDQQLEILDLGWQ